MPSPSRSTIPCARATFDYPIWTVATTRRNNSDARAVSCVLRSLYGAKFGGFPRAYGAAHKTMSKTENPHPAHRPCLCLNRYHHGKTYVGWEDGRVASSCINECMQALRDATGIARTSHTPSPVIAVVCQTLRSASLILVERKLPLMSSPSACTLSLWRENKSPARHLRLLAFAATNTL